MRQINTLSKRESYKNSPRKLPEKIQKSIQHKVDNLRFMDKRADKLARHFFSKKFLSGNNKYFRKRQQFAMRDLIRNLNEGKNGGLIKLPTGTGKTFLFGNIIQALACPSIILVPRENLVNGTYDELVGNAKKTGIGFDAKNVHKIYGKEKGTTSDQARNLLKGGEFSGTLIITYQSFVRLCESDPALFEQLMKNVGCLISDEAHRSLGEKTSQSINTAKGIRDEEFLEESEENEDIIEDTYDKDAEAKAEQLIDDILKKTKMVHVHTTATPQLALKRVEEEIVYAATFGEVVIDGDLILPKQLSLGTAKTEVEGEKITEKENKKGLDRFYFEDGTLVYEELTLQYMEQKEQNGGYLPTVAFCNTTEQAEFYVQYLLQQGIKAIQCTTNSSGTNYCDIPTAEAKLESGEAEVIVTCSKVGEGWDLPTLRGVLWLVPSLSPARVMQGTGRITRIISEADIERLMELTGLPREYIEKTHQNTIVFSPNKWSYTKATQKEDDVLDGGRGGNSSGGDSSSSASLGDVYTGMELYGKYGELSMEQIEALGLDIEGLRLRISKEVLFQTLWKYEGRREQESYGYFMGLNAKEIKALEIGGNKVISLQTLSGIEVKGNVYTPSGFQEWIEKVFEGKKIEKQETLTKETLFIKLWSYKRSEQESYDFFMRMNAKEIQAFEIGGNKVRFLQTLSGIEVKGSVINLSGFQEWIEKVFEEKKIIRQKVFTKKILTKETLFIKLWSYKRSEQESYDFFMRMNAKEIQAFEIGGSKVRSLQTLSGVEVKGNVLNPSGFQEWIEKIFEGRKIERQETLTKETLFIKLWSYKKREQESYGYFMGLNAKEIKALEIGGNKIRSLETLSGIEVKGNIQTPSGFQEWIEKVFEGKKIEKQEILTKEKLFIKLWNFKRSEQESYDYFMRMSQKEINEKFEIGGNKVTSLQTLSGIEVKGKVLNPSGFQEWIEKVFEGKKIIRQKVFTKETLTKETLFIKLWNFKRSEQESYEYFMGMNAKEIQAFEIGGSKVRSLQTLLGVEVKGSLINPSGFQEWIEKIFEGKKITRQETLFTKLWSYKRSEQESYDFFMEMNAKEIKAFEIGGNKVISLQKLSGIEVKGNVQTLSGFQEWIEKVFEGRKIEKQKTLTKEKLFIKLWSYKRSEQESYGYFMRMNAKEIQAFEIGGSKVRSLHTLSGIEVKGNVQNPSGFQEWIEKVFEGRKIFKK